MKDMMNAIRDAIRKLEDGLLESHTLSTLRATILEARDALRDAERAREAAIGRQPVQPRDLKYVFTRVVLTPAPGTEHLPLYERGEPIRTTVTDELYVLDGHPTTSKIYAIKYIRQRSGMGLKDSKDYVDNLPPVFVGPDQLPEPIAW